MGELGRVAAVVHAFGGYATAAAEMGRYAVPAVFLCGAGEFYGVVAAAAAFQPVQLDDAGGLGVGRVEEVVGDEVFAEAVGDEFAAIGGGGALEGFGVERFAVAAAQPFGGEGVVGGEGHSIRDGLDWVSGCLWGAWAA